MRNMGAPSDDHDDFKTKEEVHEDDEHIHDMVVVEVCSTSWSSVDDDQSTTNSLDKIDGDDSSVANDDSTPSTLDDQVGSGIGSNKSKVKGKKWGKKKYNRKMKKQEEMKLSHFMCFQCHELEHLANGCPNKEKLKLKKGRREA